MTSAPSAQHRRPLRFGAAALAALLGTLGGGGCAATAPVRSPETTTSALPPPAASHPAPPAAPQAAPTPRNGDGGELQSVLRDAVRARHYEDHGEYAAALVEWRKLRARVPSDGDLELAIAIDEARGGHLDSAATRLSGPVLTAAAQDTLPTTRYRPYPLRREGMYVNGTFDGWHWYVWRTRAEVAARRGRWEEATAAARRCVAARPTSGKQWLLLAVCAGQAGHADEARAAARQAVRLDSAVPEALYLDALWAWKDGRRADAQAGFRAAVALDSTFRPGIVGLVRSRLPGASPDSLPREVLVGPRAVAMLTTRDAPKVEDDAPMDQVPIVASRAHPAVPDSLLPRLQNKRILMWLFVDTDGRVAVSELAWTPPEELPTSVVSELMSLLPTWRFLPARVRDVPRGVWVDFHYVFPR